MDLGTIRNSVARKIGLTNAGGHAETTLMNQWINEGVVDVMVRTRCKIKKANLALTAGEEDYELASQIMAVEEIYNTDGSGTIWPLTDRQLSLADIITLRRTEGTSPSRYYAVSGYNMLHVYPTPSAGETITMYYVPRPTALSADTDIPSDIPLEWHKAVELYALWQAGDQSDDSGSGHGDRYRRDYMLYIMDIKKAMKRMRGKRLGPARRAWRALIPTITNRGDDYVA